VPSGVWTGHINPGQDRNQYCTAEKTKQKDSPHDSGKSFRTVVVFKSAKNAPRCIHLKWLIYRCQFNFSATIVNPEAC
jgi:hypothetical protein